MYIDKVEKYLKDYWGIIKTILKRKGAFKV
jgi:hypothetical protein